MLGSVAAGLQGSSAGWVALLLDAVLLLGVLKGKEGARNLLMLLAVGGLLVGAFGAVLVGLVLVAGHVSGGDLGVVLLMLAGTTIVLLQNGFALWCLSRRDVQSWMFQRSLGPMSA
jgi:hypothetical protein